MQRRLKLLPLACAEPDCEYAQAGTADRHADSGTGPISPSVLSKYCSAYKASYQIPNCYKSLTGYRKILFPLGARDNTPLIPSY